MCIRFRFRAWIKLEKPIHYPIISGQYFYPFFRKPIETENKQRNHSSVIERQVTIIRMKRGGEWQLSGDGELRGLPSCEGKEITWGSRVSKSISVRLFAVCPVLRRQQFHEKEIDQSNSHQKNLPLQPKFCSPNWGCKNSRNPSNRQHKDSIFYDKRMFGCELVRVCHTRETILSCRILLSEISPPK